VAVLPSRPLRLGAFEATKPSPKDMRNRHEKGIRPAGRHAAAGIGTSAICEWGSATCDLASTLRSFLRHPHLAGLIEELRWYEWFRRSPIRGTGRTARLEPATIKKLLTSYDRRTLVDRRDHAIPLLLSRLGCAPAREPGFGLCR
jgi:hypothetical protein